MSKHVSDIANNASPTDVIGGDDYVITGNSSTERFKAIPSGKGFVSKQNLKKAILSYLGIVFPQFTQAEIDSMQGISEHYVIENSDTRELIRWNGTEWVPLGSGGTFVPYSGATGDVDLGQNAIGVGRIQINSGNENNGYALIQLPDKYEDHSQLYIPTETANHYIATTSNADGSVSIASPYKVYTALLSCTEGVVSSNVLENTTQGTISFSDNNGGIIDFTTDFYFKQSKLFSITTADSALQGGTPNMQVFFVYDETDPDRNSGQLRFGSLISDFRNIGVEFRFYN